MDYAALLVTALWALIPSFIADKKGHSFWGYFFLSFLITPLVTTIIAICLRKTNPAVGGNMSNNAHELSDGNNSVEKAANTEIAALPEEKQSTAALCALPEILYCRKCGFQLLENSDFCSKCGTPIMKE